MKKIIISKVLLFLLILLISSPLSACKNPIPVAYEMEDLNFIIALGIDKGTENKDNVRITIVSERIQGSGKGSQEVKSAEIDSSEGKTIFDALRNISTFNKKKLFWGHIKYVLIGEDIARNNVLGYLDIISRDHEVRPDVTPIVVKGSTAEEILNSGKACNQFIPDLLKSLLDNVGLNSISRNIKLTEALIVFDNEYSDAYLPYIELKKNNESDSIKKSEIILNGYAAFKGTDLVDFMSEGTARGVNWITGKVITALIVVKDSSGKNVSLEVIDSDTKIKSKFNNNIPEITINIKVSSAIDEQFSQIDIDTESELNNLEKEQKNFVKSEVESALDFARKNNIDMFEFGDLIYHQHPLKWKSIKSDWKTILSNMKINVVIESKISRTYLRNEPIRSKSGENK
jgi:spore germination protein KC